MGDFTMGLAQIMSGETTRIKKEPNKSVKLYTLIKDYAQRKYDADDSTVMKLYIGTKHAAEITDNGALIAYVDSKLKPEQPEQQSNPEPQPEPTPVADSVPEPLEQEQPEPEQTEPTAAQRPQQLRLDIDDGDELTKIRDCIGNAEIEWYKNKVKITVDEPDRGLELAYKMKQNGYKYNTKRGLSYFFVKS